MAAMGKMVPKQPEAS
jgi:hypothetical protein